MRRVLLVVAVLGVIAWLQIAKTIDQSSIDSEKPQVAKDSPTAESSKDPPTLKAEKKIKTQLARKFVATYYSRNRLLFEGSIDERTQRFEDSLRPIVSENFLEKFVRPLALPQDIQLVDSGGSVSAEIAFFSGGHDEEMLATVVRTISRFQGPPTKIESNIEVTLVKEDNTWQVDSVKDIS